VEERVYPYIEAHWTGDCLMLHLQLDENLTATINVGDDMIRAFADLAGRDPSQSWWFWVPVLSWDAWVYGDEF